MPFPVNGSGMSRQELRDELASMEQRLTERFDTSLASMEQRLTERNDTKLASMEQRVEVSVADLVREGTDKILGAVRELAETKADKADVEKLQATVGEAFLE